MHWDRYNTDINRAGIIMYSGGKKEMGRIDCRRLEILGKRDLRVS